MSRTRALSLHLVLVVALSATSLAPARAADPPAPAQQVATGTVVETLDASSYTYVRVKLDQGEIWAAASHFDVAVGDRVTVPLDMPMENFHSDTLKRDFPLIYFTSRIERAGAPSGPAALPPSHPPTGGAMPTPSMVSGTEPVKPAAGGLTVAQVWADRTRLAGTKVTVRGRVVKYNSGILGRNWLHLQDGSGSSGEGTHDLTVTTAATSRVGLVVTATGTVVVDKDFGAGYSYKVLLEDATVETR
jgi:hypothetical protein